MKNIFGVIGLSIMLTLLSACTQQEGMGEDTLRGKTPDNMNTRMSQEKQDTQFGYVRYNEKQLDMEKEANFTPKIDREKMADMITKTILKLENIEEAATLVTDSQTFVAYTKKDDADRARTADTVKQTTLSFLPRWYDVYVTDQSRSFDELQSLSNNSTTEQEDDPAIQRLIKQFKEEAPQGGVYESENDRMNNM
ncbi:YhcN/YlaJ family sporulation lipoprotein [Salinibacillus xinjiangensis]|uniref:Sporulation protein n=1 Tax=Salinibacillus xinjiangensis TaxID=1229268 RepID=A0A6G1X2G1_9BACI|nr:YhcN/YlaJ family sporulation lipoprotein [Salinibacillus xinjiangensis]MRG85171.1 hypothetical protein [Salinibacillus xinjiangensis]